MGDALKILAVPGIKHRFGQALVKGVFSGQYRAVGIARSNLTLETDRPEGLEKAQVGSSEAHARIDVSRIQSGNHGISKKSEPPSWPKEKTKQRSRLKSHLHGALRHIKSTGYIDGLPSDEARLIRCQIQCQVSDFL